MNSGIQKRSTALADARVRLLKELAVLDLLPIDEQVQIAQEIEAFRNQLNAVDWVLLAGLDRADAADGWARGTCGGC